MNMKEFVEQLIALTGQKSLRSLHHRPFHLIVHHGQRHVPSSLLLEWEGIPTFAITVIDLQADYQSRTLLIGQQFWRMRNAEVLKRHLSELMDAFLAEFAIQKGVRLPKPFYYRGIEIPRSRATRPPRASRLESRPARQIIQRLLRQGSARGNAFSRPR